MTDGRLDMIEDDGILNFHTFWKGEENARTIRNARGKSHYKTVLLHPSNFTLTLYILRIY